MFVPESVELGVDRVDLGPYLGIVLVGEPVPESCALLAQFLDLRMDLFDGSHDGFNGRHAHDIPAESSALPEEDAPKRSDRCEGFPHPVGDGGQFELLAGHLMQQLVGGRLLPLRPELAQQGAGLTAGEPGVAEALAEMGS
jgi:hypothetical protein